MNEDLDMYLMQVARQLRGLPPQQREDELHEIENHLRALIEAREVDGVLYSDAVGEALSQFGNPRHVGHDLTRAWHKKHTEHPLRAVAAAVGSIACYIGFYVLLSGIGYVMIVATTHDGAYVGGRAAFLTFLFKSVYFGIAPFTAGVIANIIAPQRGWWAALAVSCGLMGMATLVVESDPVQTALTIFGIAPALLCGAFLSKKRMTQRQIGKALRA